MVLGGSACPRRFRLLPLRSACLDDSASARAAARPVRTCARGPSGAARARPRDAHRPRQPFHDMERRSKGLLLDRAAAADVRGAAAAARFGGRARAAVDEAATVVA